MNATSLSASQLPGNDPFKVCVARQPILDGQCNVVAYELLFRQINEDVANVADATHATLSVINNAFTNIGIESVLGNKKAFINFDAKTLQGDIFDFLPAGIIVLEILESVEVNDDLLERLKALKAHGYSIALDDFVYDSSREPLLEIADIVKLDVSLLDAQALAWHVQLVESHAKQLLAEKVETHEQFELCKSLGCSLFQGFFFAKPMKLIQADIPASTLRILDIMNNIMADAEITFLERAVSHDLSLTYKLLRFVNSAGLSCGRELRTVKQALSMLGRNQLYRWLSLILFTSSGEDLNQTNALLNAALYRGRLLEIFSEYTKMQNPNELFILGAFSYLEALLNREFSLIMKDMLIPAPIKQALIDQDGPYWPYLHLALTIDGANIQHIESLSKNLGLALSDINQAQLLATAYSENLS